MKLLMLLEKKKNKNAESSLSKLIKILFILNIFYCNLHSANVCEDLSIQQDYFNKIGQNIKKIDYFPKELSNLIAEYATEAPRVFVKVKAAVSRNTKTNSKCSCAIHNYNLKIPFTFNMTIGDLKKQIWNYIYAKETDFCLNVWMNGYKPISLSSVDFKFFLRDSYLIIKDNSFPKCLSYNDSSFIDDDCCFECNLHADPGMCFWIAG